MLLFGPKSDLFGKGGPKYKVIFTVMLNLYAVKISESIENMLLMFSLHTGVQRQETNDMNIFIRYTRTNHKSTLGLVEFFMQLSAQNRFARLVVLC